MAQDADDLVAQLKKRFPEREFYALVADLKGRNSIWKKTFKQVSV